MRKGNKKILSLLLSFLTPEASTLYKNNNSTDVVHYPLHFMDFYCGTTTKHSCITISIS